MYGPVETPAAPFGGFHLGSYDLAPGPGRAHRNPWGGGYHPMAGPFGPDRLGLGPEVTGGDHGKRRGKRGDPHQMPPQVPTGYPQFNPWAAMATGGPPYALQPGWTPPPAAAAPAAVPTQPPPATPLAEVPVTTLMLRHIPKSYAQQELLEEVSAMGFLVCIDFFYLPIDFRSGKNVGYSFINFTTADAAKRFKRVADGMTLAKAGSEEDRPLEVCPARLQGRHANIEHFRNSAVMMEAIPAESQPVLFDPATGERIPFPKPNGQIRKKTLRKARALAVGA
mmetsp:Transcript_37242/g.89554  ORF Transcript_37242/g.89554 Transcript_37242/m.89554 type:complete len:281 (+) Transcript_37242:23-865(+)